MYGATGKKVVIRTPSVGRCETAPKSGWAAHLDQVITMLTFISDSERGFDKHAICQGRYRHY